MIEIKGKKTKIGDYPTYELYLYEFDNGNSYRECELKWKQRDFGTKTVGYDIAKKLNNRGWRIGL